MQGQFGMLHHQQYATPFLGGNLKAGIQRGIARALVHQGRKLLPQPICVSRSGTDLIGTEVMIQRPLLRHDMVYLLAMMVKPWF